ncbi:hypothetical protein NUW54_g1546 [Trametes sanguinea]|uniref:Uncharacterized protein n=1 Tax=Trametes sanguinea TaxID=158606 RepID=A0ACC1Q903_9APHY|nr:hypothetical protein NUW54_g1546 [Trametes sanguinea]
MGGPHEAGRDVIYLVLVPTKRQESKIGKLGTSHDPSVLVSIARDATVTPNTGRIVASQMDTPKRLPHYVYLSPEAARRQAERTRQGLYNLLPDELLWHRRQHFLEENGYYLRPRYREGWQPSWMGTNISPDFCEDFIVSSRPQVIDARRKEDDFLVTIKTVSTKDQEISVRLQFLFIPSNDAELPPPRWYLRCDPTSLEHDHPVRYYYVDFGLSVRFPENAPTMVVGDVGRDDEVPELSSTVPYDAFKADVYALGNLFDKEFEQQFHRLEFLRPLIDSMKQRQPEMRLPATELVLLFEQILTTVNNKARRWRLSLKSEGPYERVLNDAVAVAWNGITNIKRSLGSL